MPPKSNFKDQARQLPIRKPAQHAAGPKLVSDKPIVPPPAGSPNRARPQVIDILTAATSIATVPVLDIVKRRMFCDWLDRRVKPRELRVVYKSTKPLSVDEVDDVIRAEVRKEVEAARKLRNLMTPMSRRAA